MISQSERKALKRSLEKSVEYLDVAANSIVSGKMPAATELGSKASDVLTRARFVLSNFDACVGVGNLGESDSELALHYMNSLATLRARAAHAADITSNSTNIYVYAYSNAMRKVSDAAWRISVSS